MLSSLARRALDEKHPEVSVICCVIGQRSVEVDVCQRMWVRADRIRELEQKSYARGRKTW